jgi:hypothetical protein
MIEQRGAPSHIEIFTDSRYTCPELCEITNPPLGVEV